MCITRYLGMVIVRAAAESGAKMILTVYFDKKSSMLVYPDIFEQGIVTAMDSSVQAAIMAEIKEAKKAAVENMEKRLAQEREAAALAAAKPGKAAKLYGTASNRIYEACIPVFGFAQEGLKEFGWNNHMYAKAATKEGYSVWMLAHSNWTDTKNGKWRNTISEGFRLITEDWGENAAGLEKELPDEIRVTFAKDASGVYVFLGVFKCALIDPEKRIKIYERISDKYPRD